MVGSDDFPFGMAHIQRRTVSFREGKNWPKHTPHFPVSPFQPNRKHREMSLGEVVTHLGFNGGVTSIMFS